MRFLNEGVEKITDTTKSILRMLTGVNEHQSGCGQKGGYTGKADTFRSHSATTEAVYVHKTIAVGNKMPSQREEVKHLGTQTTKRGKEFIEGCPGIRSKSVCGRSGKWESEE